MLKNLKLKNKYILILFFIGSIILIIGAVSKINGYEYSKGILILGIAIKVQVLLILFNKYGHLLKQVLKN
jgi:hypothetical protein